MHETTAPKTRAPQGVESELPQPSSLLPTLSVLIVNWNTRALLEKCLRSLADAGPAGTVEIIVVDNASSDDSVAMLRRDFPQVRLIANRENVGFARANNQAIAQAGGRYLLLLNSDTEVQPGALADLITFMEHHRAAGAVGPRLLNGDGTLQPSCQPMLTPWREFWRLAFLDRIVRRATYDMHTWDTQTPRRVAVIKGACLLLRRDALNQVGPLDSSYFMYTEEVDLCYRLAQAGWQLWWAPAATVIHHGEASSRQVAQAMYVQLYRSKVQFYRKMGGNGYARQFKRLVRIAYAPRWLLASAGGCFRPGWRARAQTYRRLLAELPQM